MQLAFPLLRTTDAVALDALALATALSIRHPDLSFIPEAPRDDSDVRIVNVDDVSILIQPVGAPFPREDLEALHPYGRRGWREKPEQPEDNLAHAIVVAHGGDDPKAQAVALTLVIAEICRSPDCLGVLWSQSQVLAHRDIIDAIPDEVDIEAPALSLWVGGLPYQSDDGVGLTTRGLAAFIGRELHFLPDARHDPADLFGHAMDFADYLYAQGPVLLDGESVGYSETGVLRASWTEDAPEPGPQTGPDGEQKEPRRWIELTLESVDS